MIRTITWGSVSKGSSFNYEFEIKENYFRFNQFIKLKIRDKDSKEIVFRHREEVPISFFNNENVWEEANKKIRDLANEKLQDLESNDIRNDRIRSLLDPNWRNRF